MIGEILALVSGVCIGSVITANIYRSSQTASTRKAIANVQRYLLVDEDKPLDKLTGRIKLHLESINEADDLVTRSEWAKRHKHRFVAQAIQIVSLRNKGITKEGKPRLEESKRLVRESGALLLGYFQFPSWMWLKASMARLKSDFRRTRASGKKRRKA